MMKWSSTDEPLQPPRIEVLEETALAMAQATIQNAINSCNIKRSDLAARMGRPRSFITKMLSGDHNLTIKTFARALAGCGYELAFNYSPIQSTTVARLDLPLFTYSQPVSPAGAGSASERNEPNSNLALAA